MASSYLASALALVTCAVPTAVQPAHHSYSVTIALDAAVALHVRPDVERKAPKLYNWHLPPLTPDQWKVAASAWGECRGHGQRCMQATVNVMHNRAKANGTTTAIESLKHAQLSCWGDANRVAMWGIGRWIDPHSPDGVAWVIARGLSIEESHGKLRDITHGAQFYHTKAVHPAWDRGMKQVAAIGPHVFYRKG